MFQITHNKTQVYSLITVTHTRKVISEESIDGLMWIWANKTAIPYITHLKRFLTDNTIWYLKKESEEEKC